MQASIIFILCSAFACLSLRAAVSPRPAGGDFAERFRQYDKNGDGKLSQDEFPYPYFYKVQICLIAESL